VGSEGFQGASAPAAADQYSTVRKERRGASLSGDTEGREMNPFVGGEVIKLRRIKSAEARVAAADD
jgi:hypothetical protein